MATAKKTTGTTAKATSRPTAKIIRNSTTVPIHMRLKQEGTNDPFRVVLEPRGRQGDVERIPAALTETSQFQQALNDGLIEVITATEAKKLEYPQVGYLGNQPVEIIRPSDVNVVTIPNWDGKGRPPYLRPGVNTGEKRTSERRVGNITGPTAVEVPGSAAVGPYGQPSQGTQMPVVTEDRRAKAEDMIPAGVDTTSRRVKVERKRG